MAVKFNPFTGSLQLDEVGSGGGGSSYLDGEVATYADLSLDAGVAPLNTAWLVRTASGVWPVSRKQAGIYIRTATGGSNRDADYTYAGTMPDVFSDANFTVYDDADSTKNLQFQLSGITTNTTRTLTVPDASGTLGWLQSVSSITVSGGHQLTAARNQRVLVNDTTGSGGGAVYLPATGNAEGDRLEVACVGFTGGTLNVRTGPYNYAVNASMGLNQQRTFIYTSGAWTVQSSVESHTHNGIWPTPAFPSSSFRVTEPAAFGTTNSLAFNLSGLTNGAIRTLTVADRSGVNVVSDTSAGTGGDVVNNIVSLTQAEYNAIGSPDAATLFLITDP